MLKIVLLMLLGKNRISDRSLFNTVKAYLILYILILPGISTAQSFDWIQDKPLDFPYNPTMLDYHTASSVNGNIYWVGLSEYIESYSLDAFGNTFIDKYDESGNLLESSEIEGSLAVVDAKCSPDGSLYLIVMNRSLVLFENGDSLPPSVNGTGSWIIKMNSIVGIEWSKIADGYSEWRCMAFDNDGNVLVGNDNFNASHISRFDANGNLLNDIEQLNVSVISSLDVDYEGNIYAAGSCAGPDANFGGVPYGTELIYNKYLVKYNAGLQPQWVKYVDDITCTQPEVTCNDPDYVYLAGDLFDETQFDSITLAGPLWVYDFFVARLDSQGNFVWARDIDDEANTGDASLSKRNFFLGDADNNVYLTGFMRGTIHWGNGIITYSQGYSRSALALKLDKNGNLVYAVSGGGESNDQSLSGTVGTNNDFYLAGYGTDDIAFGNLSSN